MQCRCFQEFKERAIGDPAPEKKNRRGLSQVEGDSSHGAVGVSLWKGGSRLTQSSGGGERSLDRGREEDSSMSPLEMKDNKPWTEDYFVAQQEGK